MDLGTARDLRLIPEEYFFEAIKLNAGISTLEMH